MTRGHFILHEKEYNAFQSVLKKVLADSYAKVVFLVDKNGSLLSSMGETADFDTTSLASLAAGNIAATGGLASLIGEKEFSILFHEGERDNMHISVVDNRLILVVIFDKRSSVGLVRLRARRDGAKGGGGRRRSDRGAYRSRHRKPFKIAHVLHQLFVPGDPLQDRLLRSRPTRPDTEPPVHLPADEPGIPGEDDLPGHGNRAHPLFRFPPPVHGRDPGVQDPIPPLHGPGTGVLRRQPTAHPAGCRRRGVLRRLPADEDGRQRRVP